MKENVKEYCPNCNADLTGEDIYETFLKQGYSPERAWKWATQHGYTKENPKFFGRKMGIYNMDRDMTVAWECPDCKHRWDRT